jgi:hypothetical protein
MDADGDSIVTWRHLSVANSDDVHAQRYNADGEQLPRPSGSPQVVLNEFRVNSMTASAQTFPSVAMDARGDAVVAWEGNGPGDASGVFLQRYAESADTAAPVIAGIFVHGWQVAPYSIHAAPVTQVLVSFSENMSTAGGTSGANSVTNPANWSVAHILGGSVSNVTISNITYGFNATTNRYEAALQLSGSFGSGNLQIIATDDLRDLSSNALDGDLDGAAGGGGSLTFGIGTLKARGPEFAVNSFTTNRQIRNATAMDRHGNFLIAWDSRTQDGNDYGAYAKRYNAAGVELPRAAGLPAGLGDEFRINEFTSSGQTSPSVAVDDNGNTVIVWSSSGQDGSSLGVYAQRYDASGARIGTEFKVNTYTTNRQFAPKVASDSDGDFVVVWNGEGTAGSAEEYIHAQRYNAAGVPQGPQFQVNTLTAFGFATSPNIAMDADGDFVISWGANQLQDGSGYAIYARRYSAAGVAQGIEDRVNTPNTLPLIFPSPQMTMDADGDYVIAWDGQGQSGDYDCFARRYNASGVAQGPKFAVHSGTTGNQLVPSIAMTSSGQFIATWTSDHEGANYDAYARQFDASGNPQGLEFKLNTYTPDRQSGPKVALDDRGDAIVAWSSQYQDGSDFGIYARRAGLGAIPTIASLSDSPDPVTASNTVTFTANGVADDGTVSNVRFYRESNGMAGLQVGTGGDALVGADNDPAGGWTTIVPTAGLPGGTYTYYAQASDDENFSSPPASTTNRITGAAALAVNSSTLQFETRQAVSITFSSPLDTSTVSLGDLVALNLNNGSTPAPVAVLFSDGNTVATWVFNSPGNFISDGAYQFTLLTGAVSDINGSTSPLHQLSGPTVFFLGGDTNRDRKVDVADLGNLATNWQQINRTFSQGNFDYSPAGAVDVNDLGILASNWQHSVAVSGASGGNLSAQQPLVQPRSLRDAIFGSAKLRNRSVISALDELN